MRVLQDGLPFLLSTLKELPQGLGRGEPFSKYAAKDLANCCFVGSLLRGQRQTSSLGTPSWSYIRKSTASASVWPVVARSASRIHSCMAWSSWLLSDWRSFLSRGTFTVIWLGAALEAPAEELAPVRPCSCCSNADNLSLSCFSWASVVILFSC